MPCRILPFIYGSNSQGNSLDFLLKDDFGLQLNCSFNLSFYSKYSPSSLSLMQTSFHNGNHFSCKIEVLVVTLYIHCFRRFKTVVTLVICQLAIKHCFNIMFFAVFLL